MKFSLVVPLAPGRNAPILESIKQLDYPKNDFHVVVVSGLNPSENRNKGAEKAKGEIIAFLDDDATLERDYLKKAEEFFQNHKEIDIVGGPQLSPLDEGGFAKISGHALTSAFGAFGRVHRYSKKKESFDVEESMLTSANLLCRKSVMDKIKFNTKLFPGEDSRFIEDAKDAGLKIAYSPEMIVYHKRRPTVKAFMKQMFNYGKVRPFIDSPKIILTRRPYVLIPSLFFIYLVLFFVLIFSNLTITGNAISSGYWVFAKIPFFGFVHFLPATAYVILAFLFSIHDALKNNNFKAVFFLPFIYLIIHVSYGSGMIAGFIRRMFTSETVNSEINKRKNVSHERVV